MTADRPPPAQPAQPPLQRPDGSWAPGGCNWCGKDWQVAHGALAACATHYGEFVDCLRELERGEDSA